MLPVATLLVSLLSLGPPAGLSSTTGKHPPSLSSTPSGGGPRGQAPGPSPLELAARDRALWSLPLAVGGSAGAGAPLGILGVFAEISPPGPISLQWGAGYGTFGLAWAGMVRARPVVAENGALYAGLGYSVNFSPSSTREYPDTVVPVASRWLNVEVGQEWRFVERRSVRVGVGHAFLLNGGSFGCRPGVDEVGVCLAASDASIGGWTPFGGVATPGQAAVASSLGRSVHFWYLHVDVAAIFGW